MNLKFLSWIIWLIEKFLGIEFKRENLNLRIENLISIAIILGITFLIVVYTPLLQVLDNMINSLQTEWIYHQALSSFKLSFVTTPIHLSLVCLFRDVKTPLLKFKNTFAAVLVGFFGVYVIIYLIQTLAKSVPSETLWILWLYPLITVAIVRLSISQEIRR